MWKTEPAVLIAFCSAVVGLLIAIGVLNAGLEDPINLVISEFVALLVVSGFIIRSQVTPSN